MIGWLLCLTHCTGDVGQAVAGPAAGGDGASDTESVTGAAPGQAVPGNPTTGTGTGALPAGPTPDRAQLDCSGVRAGAAPLRRLSVFEYDNTVRDLLGDNSAPAARLVTAEGGALSDELGALGPLAAEQYAAAAEDVSARLATTESLPTLLGCTPDGDGESDCVLQFIRDLLPRAYRRPTSDAEVGQALDLFTLVRNELGYEQGVRAVVEFVLQSSHFLYRVETAGNASSSNEAIALGPYQLATRLSYLFWSTMPDAELFDAAREGQLQTREQLESQARRLLGDPRAEPMVETFFGRYLDLDHIRDVQKSEDVYPDFDSNIAQLMEQETTAFVREVVRGGGNWKTLLQAPWSMMNRELAEYYGVTGPETEAFERVELDPAYHAGLLTQGSLLASRARPYESSPIHRGMFIRERIMCGTVPDVPEGLDTTPPAPDPNLTTRERLAEHRADPVCGACHRLTDPLGFSLEHFDGAGRFRTEENNVPIDASGFVVASDLSTESAPEAAFDGVVDLAGQLVNSRETQLCFVKHWHTFAHGRPVQQQDLCGLYDAFDAFEASSFDVRELLVALTQTDAFRYRLP